MGTKHFFKNVRTLTMALALCAAAAATMLVACQKDTNNGKLPDIKLTMNCSVKEVAKGSTTLNVSCTGPAETVNYLTYFYADTVPHSTNTSLDVTRRAEYSDRTTFIPKANDQWHSKHAEPAGEYVLDHSFDGEKLYYIGAYMTSWKCPNDTVWSDVYEYKAPVSTELVVSYTITDITAHSAIANVSFSIPVNREMLYDEVYKEYPHFVLRDENFELQKKVTFPEFEGRHVTVVLDELKSNFKYMGNAMITFEGDDYTPPEYQHFTTLPE